MQSAHEWVAASNLLGQAPSFQRAMALLRRCAACDATVLLQGETGTGKELAARAIHHLSRRRERPFLPVNCGAIPDTLFEAELFGHERGAFTDARGARQGLVAAAGEGTLFLDEIEALSARGQIVLLRFLQDRCYRPVGSTREHRSGARVLAASNVDLDEMVRSGRFRADLLYRVRVLQLQLPPLRQRREDIALLAEAFLARLAAEADIAAPQLSPDALAWLQSYGWPGNVRELEALIQRAWLLYEGAPQLRLADLLADVPADLDPPPGPGHPPPELESAVAGVKNSPTFADIGAVALDATPSISFSVARAHALEQFERSYLKALLLRANGNLCLAARLSQHDRGSLRRLLLRHGLAATRYRLPG